MTTKTPGAAGAPGHPPLWRGDTPALWQEAIAVAPGYVSITSWNDWHEGS
jgi:hypothetical protein